MIMSNNRDPLGLTQPPPDIRKLDPSDDKGWNIEEDHAPEDADCGDNRRNYWKVCFVAYRHKIHGESDQCIAKLLKHSSHGDIETKRHRIYCSGEDADGKKHYRYTKFSQAFVDRWVDIAKIELTKIHDGNEEYALTLLPSIDKL